MMDRVHSQTQKVHSDPKFSTTLTGDFTFDLYRSRSRCAPFLLRNIRQFLAYHRRQGQNSAFSSRGNASSRINFSSPNDSEHRRAIEELQNVNNELEIPTTLPIRPMETSSRTSTRRTIRRTRNAFYNQENAALKIDLRNVRKLLNFTTNCPDGTDERPSKRIKKDEFKGICSLTIWDNRPGEARLVTKKTSCSLTVRDNGVYGPFVSISLQQPFLIMAKDLKVDVDRDGEARLEVIEDYFLELKIIPSRQDVDWPPVPILGKSHGDLYSGPDKLPKEALTGALVVKYMGLPRAPERNTPLKVFFLQDGITFKTKYGLETVAEWCRPETSGAALDGVSDPFRLDWGNDTQQHTAINTNPKEQVETSRLQRPKTSTDPSKAAPESKNQQKYRVTYYFEPTSGRSQDAVKLKEYRTAVMGSLACPACPRFKATDLEELRFHFLSSHHRYNFTLTEIEDSSTKSEPVFEVTAIPAPKSTRLLEQDVELDWERKATRLDLKAFLNGDMSWFGRQEEACRGSQSSSGGPPPKNQNLKVDQNSDLRFENDGFLPVESVKDFRKTKPKKHPVIELVRKIDKRKSSYTSVSHRPISPGEDSISDSDDEADDEWFIERHLEMLAITSRDAAWHPIRYEFYRRWDKHRLAEKLEPTRYMSDSLIRFVRRESEWLASHEPELNAVFREHLKDMLDARYVSSGVVEAVMKTIADAKKPIAQTADAHQDVSEDGEMGAASLEALRPETLKALRIILRSLDHDDKLDAEGGLTDEQYTLCSQALGISRHSVDAEFRKWNRPPLKIDEAAVSAQSPAAAQETEQTNTLDHTVPTSAEEEIAIWRTKTLLTLPDHCATCTQPIQNLSIEAIHCVSIACPNATVWFHKTCEGFKKSRSRSEWLCKGCRAQRSLDKRRAQEISDKEKSSRDFKGKGKATTGHSQPGMWGFIDGQMRRTPRKSNDTNLLTDLRKEKTEPISPARHPIMSASPGAQNKGKGRIDDSNYSFLTEPIASKTPSSRDKGKGKACAEDSDDSYGSDESIPSVVVSSTNDSSSHPSVRDNWKVNGHISLRPPRFGPLPARRGRPIGSSAVSERRRSPVAVDMPSMPGPMHPLPGSRMNRETGWWDGAR